MGTWNKTYKELYDKTNSLIEEDISMKSYNEKEPLYLETDAVGVGFGACLLQARDGMNC